jgi:nitrous oxide reductase accessory protein NosL
MRTTLLLLTALLAGCASATGPSPQSLDTRAICQQLGQASASSPELRSDAYVDQCMIARGLNPQGQ